MAYKLAELELAAPFAELDSLEGYELVQLLVRRDGRPLGWTRVPTRGRSALPAEEVWQAVVDQLGWQMWLETSCPPAPPPAERPPFSLIVGARHGAGQLHACLEALRDLDYPAYEVLVVADGSEREVEAALPGLARHLRVEGLFANYDAALAAARHPLIACLDDAGRPDRGWLRALASALAPADVAAATGLTIPAVVPTEAQAWFETWLRVSWERFSRRALRDGVELSASIVGAGYAEVGANLALRREALRELGGLGAGDGAAGELLRRLVARGQVLVYEPAALLWRHAYGDDAAIARMANAEGWAFGAFLKGHVRTGALPPGGWWTAQWRRARGLGLRGSGPLPNGRGVRWAMGVVRALFAPEPPDS